MLTYTSVLNDRKLNQKRVEERAKLGQLIDGSGATCIELKKIIDVDRNTLNVEKKKLDALRKSIGRKDPQSIKRV